MGNLSLERRAISSYLLTCFSSYPSSRMQIKAYLKPSCGWSNGVRTIMRKYSLPFEDIDIINNRANYAEMVQKSGQPLSPCVEIDGVMLADISGEEVENYMLSNNLVKPTDVPARMSKRTSGRVLAGSSSRRYRMIPASHAPRAPPPLHTSPIFGRVISVSSPGEAPKNCDCDRPIHPSTRLLPRHVVRNP